MGESAGGPAGSMAATRKTRTKAATRTGSNSLPIRIMDIPKPIVSDMTGEQTLHSNQEIKAGLY